MSGSNKKPAMRGIFHKYAFFVSVPACIYLVSLTYDKRSFLSVCVYAFSVCALLGVSATYHRGTWSERGRLVMKGLDHAMIFLLIAGTYTPVCLLVLDQASAKKILAIVWLGGIAGILIKLVNVDGMSVATGLMHFALGWCVMLELPQLRAHLTSAALFLLLAGGVLYTGGAMQLACKRPNPWPNTFEYHEVWHAFMTLASISHWMMIVIILKGSTVAQ